MTEIHRDTEAKTEALGGDKDRLSHSRDRPCATGAGRLVRRAFVGDGTADRFDVFQGGSELWGANSIRARESPDLQAGGEFWHPTRRLCTYVKGAGLVKGGGRIGRARGVWPEPMLALVATAQEVTLGLLRRLIPRPGHGRLLPGALGARRKLSPLDGPKWFRTSGCVRAQTASAVRTW